MFNLPFPTDSLYKFCFMFGLVLIVYAIYYSDSHLERYEKGQPRYLLDSINRRIVSLKLVKIKDSNIYQSYKDSNKAILDTSKNDSIRKVKSRQLLVNAFYAWKQNSEVRRQFVVMIKTVDSLIKSMDSQLKSGNYLGIETKFENLEDEINLRERNAINRNNDNIDHNMNVIFYNEIKLFLIAFIGTVLFLIGSYFWYVKIQVFQDRILILQLAQLEKTLEEEKKKNFGRKHHDPINVKLKNILKFKKD